MTVNQLVFSVTPLAKTVPTKSVRPSAIPAPLPDPVVPEDAMELAGQLDLLVAVVGMVLMAKMVVTELVVPGVQQDLLEHEVQPENAVQLELPEHADQLEPLGLGAQQEHADQRVVMEPQDHRAQPEIQAHVVPSGVLEGMLLS